MRFFKRGEIVDTRITFLDSATNEPIDVDNPEYKIVHFVGASEEIDVAFTTMQKIVGNVGEYIINFTIPNTAPENETFFVTATGIHPITGTTTVIEDFFRVLPDTFFAGGGGGGGTGLVAKFTKP